jgi:hypothetical protein
MALERTLSGAERIGDLPQQQRCGARLVADRELKRWPTADGVAGT